MWNIDGGMVQGPAVHTTDVHGAGTLPSRQHPTLLPLHTCISSRRLGSGTLKFCRFGGTTKCFSRPLPHVVPHGSGIRCIANIGIGSTLALLCLVGNGKAEAAQQVIEGPARVIDGDTLEVSGERIRLFGLDAPEKAQSCSDQDGKPYACGILSKEALQSQIGGVPVQCHVRNKDMYGRSVSQCTSPGIGDIGHWLVQHGYAIAYRQYSKAYVPDEEEAQQTGQGMWKGAFETPADWRKEHKKSTTATKPETKQPSTTPGRKALLQTIRDKVIRLNSNIETHKSGCDVKCNISANGRILFSPGDRGYDTVKIDTQAGERWFCGVEQAENAGWKHAKY